MVSIDQVLKARERIGRLTRVTPLKRSEYLSQLTGASVFLKLENEQISGSFKVRGALNRMMTLTKEEIARGVITASTGNHGLGVAFAAGQLGIKARVVFPTEASQEKHKKMSDAGVEVIQEVGYAEIEDYAQELAKDKNLTYVSPYNDSEIIAGAGTVGLEILEQSDHIDAIIVPIGGGGLISGIATAVKVKSPKTQIIGVQSEVSPEVYESWKAGHWVEAAESDSLAQGLMGGVESDSITLGIIQKYVDRIVLVHESSILEAICLLYEKERLVIEGAGAASVAVLLEMKQMFSGKSVVAVISGGNISEDHVKALIYSKTR
ncbi:MAG: pyridoxal-phosphate dependent enzyme [Candidatus Thorarchaeota archaeon]|nr:pyridoxal-phosphate dependent enzyme [Candidatus Thorarchaeota archaeon]